MTHICPERLIFLGGNLDTMLVDEASIYLFLLDRSNLSDIYLYLHCHSGSASACLSFYDAMQMIEADIATFCQGEATAITALILSGGTKGKRFIHPAAQIRLLPVSFESDEIPEGEITRLLAESTGHSPEEIEDALINGLLLTASDAVSYGLADFITDNPLNATTALHW